MKILLYVSHLSNAGGAEKVVSLMANHWVKKHQVIILSESHPDNDFFSIDSKVQREVSSLDIRSEKFLFQLNEYKNGLLDIRKVVKKVQPDIIISHIDRANITMLLATYGLGIPVIVEDHNNPELKKLPQPWSFFKKVMYKRSKKVILLTRDLLQFYPKSLHAKISFIENPLNVPTHITDSDEIELATPTFIALGSLTEQKGLDYLLEAYAMVCKEKPDWKLTILGEGTLKSTIEAQAKKLGIDQKVYLPGRVNNPYPILKNADIYVMSSRYEGYPVALCEAMAVGLPCISFDCPTGPADIIEHNVNGLLVEYLNVEKLAEEMIMLSKNVQLRKEFSEKSVEINDKLHVNTIMSKWDKVIDEVLND